ncbi:uncharacterized protein LOC129191283 isoform X1 [Dunckerocampus dactyliophorus]|uniref:uncharacterized protein LOC129191283 isoform X1 n=1 Tax=Dunckerocampus dactyliophorus TaxID=161453 RepID=UPI0024070D85|nr:uncharacterized protein LOC129191283 isoform X1 [Dunckerocampus dactyliophorus]
MRMILLLVQLATCCAIGSAIKCYQCNLGASYFTRWDWSAKCTLTPCPAGEQCFITKDQSQVTYKMGCKADCEDDDYTKCCDSDGCNNWLDVADDANQRTAVSTACNKANNDVKQCLDAIIKTKTPSCYSCSDPLGANYFTSWDWSAQCTLTPCKAGDQCSITKVSGAYQVGCKTGCKDDANTKCCDANGCNNWLNVGEDANPWKKVEAIKAACSPSSNDPKDCLKAIDPNLISGGGGLAGALGLPLVLAISVIVLVVLG